MLYLDTTSRLLWTSRNITYAGNLLYSNSTLSVNKWYHVAVTWGSGGQRIYVDGIEDARSDYPGSYYERGFWQWTVGRDQQSNPGRYFNGTIDEVAVFNRALSQAEVQIAMQGDILAVNASGKLSTTWGRLKNDLR